MILLPSAIRRRVAHRPNLSRILDNLSWLFVDKLIHLGLGLVVGVWVARYLGPQQFGLINYALAVVGLFGTFATLGLNSIVVRDLVREPKNAHVTLGTAAALQFLGGLVAFTLVIVAISLLRPDDALARWIVMILGSLMFLKISAVASYWFEAKVKSKYVVWVNNIVFLIFAAVKVALIVVEAPLMAFVWVMFAESIVNSLGTIAIFAIRGISLPALRVRLDRAAILLRDSWPLVMAGLAIAIYVKINIIMLGQMLGDEAVGIYSAATRVSEIWYFIPTSIVVSVFPAILDTKKTNMTLYYQRFQQLYDLMVVISVAVALPMTFLSEWLVVSLFGAEYGQAGPVLAIHIWASVFVFLGLASGRWFISESRQVLNLQRALLGAVVNVALKLCSDTVVRSPWGCVGDCDCSGMCRIVIRSVPRRNPQYVHNEGEGIECICILQAADFTGNLKTN